MLSRLRSWRRAPVAPVRAQVDVADLLGRARVNLDTPELQRFLADKRVMITGAGGSIGSELSRQAMRFCPAKLILVERAENALFEIDHDLRQRFLGSEIVPCVADVTDARRIAAVFAEHQPQVVFHAAAHKHVPMMEHNAGEAIKNNVLGTKCIADACIASGVDAFVLISTDKAVNPTSVMGATKRVAELYTQSLNVLGKTRFVAVRFGNVLGSSGSVVPIFTKQIESGGPVTITHPEMRRYFMTIPEATQLVMQAGAIGRGGEIFVLDMGEPVRIVDLAENMIRRAGLLAGRDIQIRFTGMRPGEKLFEELSGDNEATRPTSHDRIRVWELPQASRGVMDRAIKLLAATIDQPAASVVAALRQIVPEYVPPNTPLPSTTEKLSPVLRIVNRDAIEDAA